MRARTWAQRARGRIENSLVENVLKIAAAPWPAGAPIPTRVPCHRDFTERNWLVQNGRFTVIDFEHARLDWALVDVERTLSSIPRASNGLGDGLAASP